MSTESLAIHRIGGLYAVCRLEPTAAVPAWALKPGEFVSVTRTNGELSIIAPETAVPEGVQAERGYIAYAVKGPLAFSMVGVLAKLTTALAIAEVPVLAISTYDTDILLVKADHRAAAEAALNAVATVA